MTELRTYTPEFDQEAYASLWTLSAHERRVERARLDAYTDKQLQTLLAERFNVLTSTFNYEMKDGQLWGENMTEPAIESFKRGRDYRKLHGNSIDHAREDAEIVGFQKIEEMLREERDVLSISPQGPKESTYQHNFYDVFRWRNGRVEVTRYSSALNIAEYQKLLGAVHQTPEEFLANPIDISSLFTSPDEVHKFLHRDHKTTSTEVFERYVLPGTREARFNLLQAYYQGDEEGQAYWSNVTLNGADEIVEWAEDIKEGDIYVQEIEFSPLDYGRLARQEVREVSTGCGSSGGFGLESMGGKGSEQMGAWSVSEFGKKDGDCGSCGLSTEDDHYHCPGCGSSYESERSKPASSRTKVCNRERTGDGSGICGFKFAC